MSLLEDNEYTAQYGATPLRQSHSKQLRVGLLFIQHVSNKEQLDIDLSLRPENLSVSDYVRIAEELI